MLQCQPVWRTGGGCGFFSAEDVLNARGLALAAADVQQGADEQTGHLMKKAVPFQKNLDFPIGFF